MSDDTNRTYLLRVWTEREHDRPPAFRAALTEVATRETVYFSDVRALARHLKALNDRVGSE
jgi:hypothetical protein